MPLFCDKDYCLKLVEGQGISIMVLNVTFNNISVISWQSVLLLDETGVPAQNH